MVRSIDKPKPKHYHIATRCLRCGGVARVCYQATELEPGEILPDASPVAEPVGTDEVLDMHEMPQDEFIEGWSKLVGRTAP